MKCARCKREAEVKLKYSKESLCSSCFIKLFEKRVRWNIRVHKLLQPTDRTAVALSGGKDSAVALYVLKTLHSKAPKAELVAISIDQGIKGSEPNIIAAKKLCKKLGVEHHIFSFVEEYGATMDECMKKIREIDDSIPACSFCGVLRRSLLNKKARELDLTKIATGHNLDDEIQVSLMNFIRGEHDRLARMGPRVGLINDPLFVPRIKPLRECPEEEVLLYAQIRDIPFSHIRCPYSSEAFRATIRKALELIEEKHPGSRFQLLKSTDRLALILRREFESHKLMRCVECGEITSSSLCRVCQVKKDLGLG